MRAILCESWGAPESLRLAEIDPPQPRSGQIAIRVAACGVNFADTLLIAGGYQHRPDFPFVPGMEMAGEVIGVGPGVSDWQVGDRVMAMQYTGGFAEIAVLPASAAVSVPASMPFETAAAFPATYSTPHIALTRRANLQPGETLLVLGAAGGIGLAAVEIGKALGATVIAGASTDEKLALAQGRGADHLINYRRDNLRGRVRAVTHGALADVIFDPVGGDLLKQAMRCLAWEGRLLTAGFASGTIPEVSVNRLLIQNTALVGVEWGTYMKRRPDLVRQSFETLLGWWSDAKIAPHVSATYPLDRTPEALRLLLNRQSRGRVVVQPGL